MRILLTYSLPAALEVALLGEHVVYRPDLAHKDALALGRALSAVRPDVVVARRAVEHAAARVWRQAMPTSRLFVVSPGADEPVRGSAPELADLDIEFRAVELPKAPPDVAALMLAERLYVTAKWRQSRPQQRRRRPRGARRDDHVVLVGAGIVNLMTAHELARSGYRVTVFEACPDPRTMADWTRFGCTRGGDNARMFTLTEADNYSPTHLTEVDHTATVFRTAVSRNGWRVTRGGDLTAEEQVWIDTYEAIPAWLAHAYTEDIFAFNRDSRLHWEELMRVEPVLFDGVGLTPNILRLYTDQGQLESDIGRQRRVGAFRRALSPAEVATDYPALASVCERGVVTGGIEVVGFTVNVHDFLTQLVGLLEKHGVQFAWNQPVTAVRRDRLGRVVALVAGEEELRADHYVVSPGVYGRALLRGSKSAGLIHGVLGLWLTIPNRVPRLSTSLKIARRGHAAEDANVTVGRAADGRHTLIIGSGYGYTGADPTNIDRDELLHLSNAVHDTARTFFPDGYAAAGGEQLFGGQRFCVRPWTASSLGIFETQATVGGGLLIITGGHNTGGFAQSPSVADAVLNALEGRDHPMHVLYHPERLASFYE